MKGVQQGPKSSVRKQVPWRRKKCKIGSEIRTAARRGNGSLGDVIILIFKIFAYFMLWKYRICPGDGFNSAVLYPLVCFRLKISYSGRLAKCLCLRERLSSLAAVPIIGIITWLIRKLARIKP